MFFLLKTGGLRMRQNVASTLELESATNDPMAVLIVVIATTVLVAGSTGFAWTVPLMLALQIGFGTVFGLAGGFVISWAINRVSLPTGLYPLMVVASAVTL